MNQRNISAIAEAVKAYLDEHVFIDLSSQDEIEDIEPLARFLAASGVLAPSAFADEIASLVRQVLVEELERAGLLPAPIQFLEGQPYAAQNFDNQAPGPESVRRETEQGDGA